MKPIDMLLKVFRESRRTTISKHELRLLFLSELEDTETHDVSFAVFQEAIEYGLTHGYIKMSGDNYSLQ